MFYIQSMTSHDHSDGPKMPSRSNFEFNPNFLDIDNSADFPLLRGTIVVNWERQSISFKIIQINNSFTYVNDAPANGFASEVMLPLPDETVDSVKIDVRWNANCGTQYRTNIVVDSIYSGTPRLSIEEPHNPKRTTGLLPQVGG